MPTSHFCETLRDMKSSTIFSRFKMDSVKKKQQCLTRRISMTSGTISFLWGHVLCVLLWTLGAAYMLPYGLPHNRIMVGRNSVQSSYDVFPGPLGIVRNSKWMVGGVRKRYTRKGYYYCPCVLLNANSLPKAFKRAPS